MNDIRLQNDYPVVDVEYVLTGGPVDADRAIRRCVIVACLLMDEK
jgi:hypothetical protein